jgi:hypothetical protein
MDASTTEALRMCPTRIDRASVLFAHKVSVAQCQDRQRGHYHKCFTCEFNNARSAGPGRVGPPAAPAVALPARPAAAQAG